MSLLLYAIAEGPVRADAVTGLDGEPLRTVGHRELTAVVGACPEPPAAEPATLAAYGAVVEALMGDTTRLPARFGSVLAHEGAVIELLRERHDELAAALHHVAGAVELGIRVDGDAAADPTGPARGSNYLRGRLEQRQAAQRLAAEIEAAVGELARDRRCRLVAGPGRLLTASYLVPRALVEEFMTRCRELGDSGGELVCSGPWPPYSFAGVQR